MKRLKSALQFHLDCFIFNSVLLVYRAEIMKIVSVSEYMDLIVLDIYIYIYLLFYIKE